MAKKATKAAKPTKPCDCADKMSELLAEKYGVILKRPMLMNLETRKTRTSQPLLVVERCNEGKKKLPNVLCSYCPFCGKKYQ